MKHVKLFEAWVSEADADANVWADFEGHPQDLTNEESSVPNSPNEMSPEEFRSAVEEIIARNVENITQIVREIKKIMDAHPYIRYGNKEYLGVLVDLVSPRLIKLNPEERDNLKRELDPEKYEEELKGKLKAEEEELKKKEEMERLRNRALEVLDGYKNGSIDADTAVDQILGMRYR